MTTLDLEQFVPPDFVEPTYLWIPPGRRGTMGDEIVSFARQLDWSINHWSIDPEQVEAIDAFGSYGPGGGYWTFETCLVEGRQNGKTLNITLPITLYDFFIRRVDRITWTSHLTDTNLATFKVVTDLIEANPMLSRRVKEISTQNSKEAITLMRHDGVESVMEFRARVSGGGRGKGGSIWVGDEWLYGTDESIGARMPTLRARTQAQIRYVSSAARRRSKHLRSLVKRGRSGKDRNLIYSERCAPGSFEEPGCAMEKCMHAPETPGCTLDREDLWHLANHAMGRRILYSKMRAERASMPATEFACEALGWHEPGDEEDNPIDLSKWTATTINGPVPGKASTLFVAGSFGLQTVAIAGAYLVGGRPHVKLADYRPGSEWVPERAKALKEEQRAALWSWESGGPESALAEDLATVARIRVEHPLTGLDMARGCVHMQKLVDELGLTHSNEAAITVALTNAVKRDVGDPGLWTWGVKKSAGDLAPLRAISGALYLLHKNRRSEPSVHVIG